MAKTKEEIVNILKVTQIIVENTPYIPHPDPPYEPKTEIEFLALACEGIKIVCRTLSQAFNDGDKVVSQIFQLAAEVANRLSVSALGEHGDEDYIPQALGAVCGVIIASTPALKKQLDELLQKQGESYENQ